MELKWSICRTLQHTQKQLCDYRMVVVGYKVVVFGEGGDSKDTERMWNRGTKREARNCTIYEDMVF